jgi:hypothetical protein
MRRSVELGDVATGQADREPHQSSQRIVRISISEMQRGHTRADTVRSFAGNKEHIYTSEQENEGLVVGKVVNRDGGRLRKVVCTSTHHVALHIIGLHSIPIPVSTDQLGCERGVSIGGKY